jgi:hypothetical protein
MIDIVTLLKEKATLYGWMPIIGAKDIQNFSVSQKDFTTGKTALLIDLPKTKPLVDNGYWSTFDCSMELIICRKFEDLTVSSVSETTEQKYTNRLFELQQDLDNFLNTFCSPYVTVKSISYEYVINILSKSVDGVLCQITYEV